MSTNERLRMWAGGLLIAALAWLLLTWLAWEDHGHGTTTPPVVTAPPHPVVAPPMPTGGTTGGSHAQHMLHVAALAEEYADTHGDADGEQR